MPKYHVTPKGDVLKCTAEQRNCTYGESAHYSDQKSARQGFEETMTKHIKMFGELMPYSEDEMNDPMFDQNIRLNVNPELSHNPDAGLNCMKTTFALEMKYRGYRNVKAAPGPGVTDNTLWFIDTPENKISLRMTSVDYDTDQPNPDFKEGEEGVEHILNLMKEKGMFVEGSRGAFSFTRKDGGNHVLNYKIEMRGKGENRKLKMKLIDAQNPEETLSMLDPSLTFHKNIQWDGGVINIQRLDNLEVDFKALENFNDPSGKEYKVITY